MDYESRGMTLQTRAEFKEEIDALLEFVRHDWYATGEYSLKEVNDIFLNEQSLDVLRTRHFVVEAPGERLFSSIRVYENSKSYEFWNRSQEKIAPPRDLIFEKFNISQENLLRLSGIEPQPRSWVIGLLNIVKTYSNAAANLLSMAATSLDYQYNSKMFASFKDLSEIKSMDMDIVMYGRKKLKKFHTRLFGKGPLKDSFGNEIEIQVDGKTYYFYHFLGSEFLSKYLDIRYHEPSFSSQTAFLKQKERTEFFQAHLQKVRHTLAEEKKGKVNDIVTFANRQIAYMRQLFLSSNNREVIEALGNLILLGKNLTPEAMLGRHEHIAFYQAQLAQILPEFVAASSSKRFKSNEEFQQFMSQLSQKDIQENILQLGMLTSVIGYDPLLFYLNNGGRFFPVAN